MKQFTLCALLVIAAAPCFAAQPVNDVCQEMLAPRGTELSEAGRAYVSIIRALAEQNALSKEALLALRQLPVAPDLDAIERLSGPLKVDAEKRHVLSITLKRLSQNKTIDWSIAKDAIETIQQESTRRSGQRTDARKETDSVVTPIRRKEIVVPGLDQRHADVGTVWRSSWSDLAVPYTVYSSWPAFQHRLIFNRSTKTVVRIDPYSTDVEERGEWNEEVVLLPTPDGKVVGAYPKGDVLHVFDAETGNTVHEISLKSYEQSAWTSFVPYLTSEGSLRVLAMHRYGMSTTLTDFDAKTGVGRNVVLPPDLQYMLRLAPKGERGVYAIGLEDFKEESSTTVRAPQAKVFSIENQSARQVFQFDSRIRHSYSIWEVRGELFRASRGDLYLAVTTRAQGTVVSNLTTRKTFAWNTDELWKEPLNPLFFEDAEGRVRLIAGADIRLAADSPALVVLAVEDRPGDDLRRNDLPFAREVLFDVTEARIVALPFGNTILVTRWWVVDLATGLAQHLPIDENTHPSQSTFLGPYVRDGRIEGLWSTLALEGTVLPMQLYGPVGERAGK